jgi:DNA polymerase III subunit epsilon
MRQIVLDTETTGLDWQRGHRVIEIGCVELLNRRQTGKTWHSYLNPQREIDEAAQEVHGISIQDLAGKPLFSDIAAEFLIFLGDAELIIHNAIFDIGFLDNELRLAGHESVALGVSAHILDTLVLARQLHPGQRNNLDALCKRYGIDNARRDLHGALLDARLLAEVYLAMTGGQATLSLGETSVVARASGVSPLQQLERSGLALRVIRATAEELIEHDAQLDRIDKACAAKSLWRQQDS